MFEKTQCYKRLKAVAFVRTDLIDAVSGPDMPNACEQFWNDVQAAIDVACAAADRVSMGDVALYPLDAVDIANGASGYYPVRVSVQTKPAELVAG